MRFRTTLLVTLTFNFVILVLDKGTGLILLGILRKVPDQKGFVDLITNLPALLMVVANLGLASSQVYFIRRKEVSVRRAGQTTAMVAIVWGLFIVSLAFIGIQGWCWLDPKHDWVPLSLLLPILFTMPCLLWVSFRNVIQLVVGHIRAYNFVHLVPSVIYLPLFLLFYYVLTDRDPIYAGVYARFLPAVFLVLFVAWLLRHHVPIKPRFDRGFFRKAMSYGWRSNMFAMVTFLNHRLDMFLLFLLFVPAAVLSSESATNVVGAEVGFYSLAVSLAELIWYFPDAMRDVVFAKVAGLSQEQARKFTPVVCRNSLLVSLFGAAFIWFAHGPLLHLYLPDAWDKTWSGTVTPAVGILLPGTLFFTATKVMQYDLAARGRVTTCIYLCLIVLVTMLIGDFLLMPRFGAHGAAIASTIAYACGAVATTIAYKVEARVSLRELVIPRREDLTHYTEVIRGLLRGKKSTSQSS